MRLIKHSILPVLLMGATLFAQQERSPYDVAVESIQKEIDSLKSKPDENIKWFGNVQTDLKNKKIVVRACATGIKPSEPVEFFVATTDSGKDYEAISIAPIKPSDLHVAIESLGLKSGHPVDFPTNHFWSRGPRLIMTFTHGDKTYRAEDLVLNLDTKKTLPQSGLLFTGSKRSSDNQYAADMIDSRTLASIYNDPSTVLDLPDRTSQSGIYGYRKIIPDLNWAKGDLITITLQPSDEVSTHDLTIHAQADGKFSLLDTQADNLLLLVQAIAKLIDGKSDWYTTVSVDDALTIDQVRKLYGVLMSVEQDKGIKLDPPKDGEIYHRGFFPEKSWRDRQDRLGEPWELFLSEQNGKWVARLERQIENPDRQASEKQIIERFDPENSIDLMQIVTKKQSHWTAAIFIYPPDGMKYGDLKKWVGPAMTVIPKVFVFPERKEK